MQNIPLKGVNLGGWLIIERWMTPTVFNGFNATDEYTLSQTVEGRAAIQTHRDTFITEADFKWLRDTHIDIIRLPVGYWIFESTDTMVPQSTYVDWVMEMAQKYELKVLIDLHGLEGSQNGYDHSGRVGKANWFSDAAYRDHTYTVLQRIAERYGTHPQLWGLQITNEPRFGVFHFKLRAYYKRAYSLLQSLLPQDVHIVFSDGFTPRLLNGALGRSTRAVMDVHLYHGTKPWTQFASLQTYYRSLKRQARLIARLARTQPVIIGEWSGTFRQPVFNAFPVADHPALIKKHCELQIDSFAAATAWFYWSYKTEQPGVWNFRSEVEAGIIKL